MSNIGFVPVKNFIPNCEIDFPYNSKQKQEELLQKFDAERRANFCSPKFFSLEKNPPNPKIRDNPHGHQ